MMGMIIGEESGKKDVLSGEMKGTVVTSHTLIKTGVEENQGLHPGSQQQQIGHR